MRKGSTRSTRINSEVQKELSKLIMNEVKDPRIHPMTSVFSCEVTPDLKLCKVYISVLADEESRKETLAGLRSAAPFLRHQLAASVNLRNTPELQFISDKRIEHGVYLSGLIDEVTKKDRKAMELRGDDPDAPQDVDEEEDF